MKMLEEKLLAKYHVGHMRSFCICALALLVIGSAQLCLAQQEEPSSAPSKPVVQDTSDTAANNPLSDSRYRIGPRDVLDIRVFNRPQFSRDAVVVDDRGMIQMPMIGEVQAACRIQEEIKKEIEERYQKYLRNPQVDVLIKDYKSQSVAVLGAVRSPARLILQRPARLLEILSHVNGPTPQAGRTIQIVHTGEPTQVCKSPEGDASSEQSDDIAQGISIYNLRDTLKAEAQANPYVRPGDIITLLDAEKVYIIGNVRRPGPIDLTEPITISQAVAMSGGILPDTNREKVRIVRQTSNGKKEMYVNLKAIDKRQEEDIALQGNDIIDISPASGPKQLLKDIYRSIVPTVTQLPVRAVY